MNIPDWIKDARCYAVPVGAILCKMEDGELIRHFHQYVDGEPIWEVGEISNPQLREAWERCPTIDETTGKAAPKDWWPDGLYVAVERRVECPRCHGDGYVVTDDKLFMCSQCNATGTIKRLDLERAEEWETWYFCADETKLSPIKLMEIAGHLNADLFLTDGIHDKLITTNSKQE